MTLTIILIEVLRFTIYSKNLNDKGQHFISFIFFGLVHVVTGWDTYNFLLTGVIGVSFAVIYIKSRNIIVPMLLHFIYDIFANLVQFIEWNNSLLFVNMYSLFEVVITIMFIISLVILVKKDND